MIHLNIPMAALWLLSAVVFVTAGVVSVVGDGRRNAPIVTMYLALVAMTIATIGLWVTI